MDELILRVLRGEASELELQRLRHWLAAAAANQRYYDDVETVWRATTTLPAAAPSLPPDPSVIARQANARRRVVRPWGATRPWMGVAAAAAAVAAGLVAIRALRPPNPGSAVAQFVAGSNSATTALLSDGSVARLAPGSRLRVASWSTRHRVVDLEGRAFFAVAHDARHPFTVRAAGSETEVLGTRFEVAADRAGVRVVVVEGRVALTAAAGRIEVSAGEVSQAREGLPLSVVRVADVYALLDWPGGLLLFQSTPLAQVAREVGRRFGRPVRVTDGEFARRQVTAWFTDESLEEVVGAICAIVAAHCEMRDTLVTVSP